MKHYQKLFIFSIFFLAFGLVHAQELYYKAFKGGEEIGELKVKKVCKGKVCEYLLENKIQVSLVFTLNLGIRFTASFQGKQAILTSSKQLRDGKIREQTSMIWKLGKYNFTRDGKSRMLEFPYIDYCSIQMYHHSPSHRSKVFSERFGKYLDIKKKGEYTYALELPGGSTNTYEYVNGICTKMTVRHTFATIRFELQASSSL